MSKIDDDKIVKVSLLLEMAAELQGGGQGELSKLAAQIIKQLQFERNAAWGAVVTLTRENLELIDVIENYRDGYEEPYEDD